MVVFLINYLAEANIGSMLESEAAKYVAVYWSGAMVGRFFGAIMLADKTKNTNLYLGLIIVLSFFLGWYLTSEIAMASVFLGLVILNFGAFKIGKNKPNKTLAVLSGLASLALIITMVTSGWIAIWAIISIGLFNSIMFPTIFALAIDELGDHTSQGSGILCAAIVGGAIIPLIQGVLADTIGIQHAFFLPTLCYFYIIYYGLKGYQHNIEKVVEV